MVCNRVGSSDKGMAAMLSPHVISPADSFRVGDGDDGGGGCGGGGFTANKQWPPHLSILRTCEGFFLNNHHVWFVVVGQVWASGQATSHQMSLLSVTHRPLNSRFKQFQKISKGTFTFRAK